MQILKALIASCVFYIAGVSAATLNTRVSSRAPNVCKADGEHCNSTVDCCASFYCASRGLVPQDYKCHPDGICGGGTAPCKDNSHCCTKECVNNQCTQEIEPDGP